MLTAGKRVVVKAVCCLLELLYAVRHLGGMPNSHIAPSKWVASMGALAVIVLAVRRFLRRDLAAVA